MAEKQASHRQGLESESLRGTIRERRAGQALGFLIGLGGLVSASILGLYGAQTVASIIGGGTLASLVSVFVLGRDFRSQPPKEPPQ